MSATILFKNDWFEFVRNDTGAHFLTVLCGGIGLFEHTIRLTAEELALIDEYGEYYLEKLALDIARAPEKFADRLVRKTDDGS